MQNNQNMNQQTYEKYQSVRESNKKAIVIALCVVAVIVVIAVALVSVFMIANSKSTPENIVDALEDGEYSEALNMYAEKYDNGDFDSKLIGLLSDRILEVGEEYFKGEISYNKALKELETIRSMGILSLDEDIDDAEDYIKGEDVTQGSSKEPLNDAPDVDLDSEPLPTVKASSNPVISSASTVKGTVLAQSDVNAARSFGANKTIDGYYDSCWCVNTENTGAAGAKIKFCLSRKSKVSGVMLVNGNLYQPEDDLYSKNGQIKRFTLTFSDGTSQSFTASFNNASSSFQTFYLDSPVETDYVLLTVESGYVGSKFTTNVCLGEFEVF